MTTRSCKFASLLTALVLPITVVQGQQNPLPKGKSALSGNLTAEKRLLGSWLPKGGGKPIVYLAHGQGKNPDGSRFNWHVEGDYLVAQALSADGKPTGDVVRIPLLFTRDGKEYATFLERGKLKTPFYHLLANGKIDAHRTRVGGDYPVNKFLPKEGDDEENTPTAHPQKPYQTPPNQAAKPTTARVSEEARPGTHIHVGPNVQVSGAWPHVPHGEVTMAADPLHADWLLAASMCNPLPYDAAAPKVIVYTSRDGGKTWQLSLTRNNPNPQTYADPAFAYGPDGTLTFVNMYWPSLDADQGRLLQFTQTHDGGRTWSPISPLLGFHDRPFLAVDTTGGRRNGWLYCTDGYPDKGVFVSKDNAATFLPAVAWSKHPHETVFVGNPVVTSDGSLVLLYTTVADPSGTTAPRGKKARRADPDEEPGRSDPEQATPPARATTVQSVAVVRSRDGGESFEETKQIATYRDGPGRGGLPMLAIDTGRGAYKDRLYAVWLDMPASGSRVMLSSSQDGGTTWSPPALISEQAREDVLPKSGSGGATDTSGSYEAFLPSVAVNKSGVVGVSWYDTRGLPPKQAGWNLRFRASLDGGNTWLPSVQITNVSTLNTPERRKRFPKEIRGTSIQPGHTAGLAADANGIFHPLWIDGRTGTNQVFTAGVTVSGNP